MIFRDKLNFYINSKLIVDYLQENKISKTEFAKMCEISIETLNQILKNNTIYHTQDRFYIMSKVLNVKYEDLVTKLSLS
ncbi:MAG: helix-turn-helix domain-containing protein [Christensenellales bacterium]